MKSVTLKMLPVIAAAALLSPLALSGTATAAPAHAACGTVPPDYDPSVNRSGRANGANMRTGSSTSCLSNGIAYSSHVLNYHCYTVSGAYTWTYARNLTSGAAGWIRDDLLSDNGSAYWCGF
jgi:hypothetical protein